MKITHGMVLAAGLGTRMRPLTNDVPKPLIPVAGKPLIDWCVDWLREGGVRTLVVNSSYRAAQLEAHIGARATISREGEPPLETGGGVLKALPQLGKRPFVTMNSDAIFLGKGEHPLRRMAAAWSKDNDFVMLLVPRDRVVGWTGNGDFVYDAHTIRRPQPGEEANYVFTGVQLMHPDVFVDCPVGPFSLSALWNRSVGPEGWYQRIHAIVYDGMWLNVGDLAGLQAAENYLATV